MSRLVSANSDRTTGHRKEIAGFAPRKMYLPGTIFARSAQDDAPLAMLRSTLVFALACCAVADGQEAPKAFPPSLAVRPFTKADFSSCGIPDPNKKVFVYVEMDVNPKGVPESVSLSRGTPALIGLLWLPRRNFGIFPQHAMESLRLFTQ